MTTTSQPTAERVGRYQLLEPIGAGPCGTVSRAKVFGVAGFERQFAIKRFHAEITASTTLAASLSAAARGYGSLEHPRIARMSEFGVAQGTTFTAVEFVAGLDALRLITEARLTSFALAAGGALALVSQAARAVGYAHGRGLTHLGLAPTNVIVTSEGDIKITDFGILAATLPSRPIDAIRLAHRVQYMAPEQLAGEATSAATDVFSLGVLAYELVTGQRAYAGDTPQQVAQAVLTGPPPEPPLPRPIVRVLQRCLARSPFERFPDARALADALDAALRVAPVPGTRKDIGAQVKQTMDRLAAMNEGEQSGILALTMVGNTAPARKEPLSAIAVLGNKDPRNTTEMAAPDSIDLSTSEFTRDGKLGGGAVLKPMNTVAGLAPPPIPVPPGVTPPPPTVTPPSTTLLGGPAVKAPPIPTSKPVRMSEAPNLGKIPTLGPRPIPIGDKPPMAQPVSTPASTTPRRPPMFDVDTKPGVQPPVKIPEGQFSLEDTGDPELELDIEIEKRLTGGHHIKPETDPGVGEPRAPAERQQRATDEMSPLMAEKLQQAANKPTRDMPRYLSPDDEPSVAFVTGGDSLPDELESSFAETELVSPGHVGAPVKPSHMEPVKPSALAAAAATSTKPHPKQNLDSTVLGPGAPARVIATKPGFEAPARSPSSPPSTPLVRPVVPIPAPVIPDEQQLDQSIVIPSDLPQVRKARAELKSAAAQNPKPIQQKAGPTAPVAEQTAPTSDVRAQKPSRKGLWITLGLVGIAALGVGGFFAYQEFLAPKDDAGTGSGPIVTPTATDAGTTTPTAIDAETQVSQAIDAGGATSTVDAEIAATPIDGDTVATAIDAGAAATIDAGETATAPIDAGASTPATGDTLSITSTPPGARVFLDGADSGVTPLKLPGTADKHSVALFLPSHELYVAQVDGRGTFNIQLKTVTPVDGPAGIKVTRCKDKDRFYVSVDGKPTGQVCPTERISTTLGPHTVEIYDLHTEKHTEYKIDVTDTRLSYRVKVDP